MNSHNHICCLSHSRCRFYTRTVQWTDERKDSEIRSGNRERLKANTSQKYLSIERFSRENANALAHCKWLQSYRPFLFSRWVHWESYHSPPSSITWSKELKFSRGLFVCFSVSRITLKLLNRFSYNSVEKCLMDHGRNGYILVVIWITLSQG